MSVSTKGTYKNQGMMVHTSRSIDFGLRPILQVNIFVIGRLARAGPGKSKKVKGKRYPLRSVKGCLKRSPTERVLLSLIKQLD